MNQDVDIVIKYQEKIMKNKDDIYFMKLALKEARKSYDIDEVPVGCVIVKDGVVIAKAHNTRQHTKNVFDHAEVVAIKKATKKLNSWILDDATLYVTLEPCLMCSGAILQSRIKKVVYATKEPKFGCMGSIINVFDENNKFNHHVEIVSGICMEESSKLLKDYFKQKRQNKQISIKLTNE